jgi:flagellin
MQINTNISALNAWRGLTQTQGAMSKSLEKLSSGLRINRAADDAAGLAISEKMRAQIKGLNQATRNAQDGISLIQTAEGALNETHSILQRMRELTVQAGNGTNQAEDLTAIKAEMDQLVQEVTGIAGRTQFNGKTLMTGTYASTGISLQIGANASQSVSLTVGDMQPGALGASLDSVAPTADTFLTDLDVTNFAATKTVGSNTVTLNFDNQLKVIDGAIGVVSTERSKLGAMQNRLEHTINNLGVASENLTAANSRIRDVDMASEMMEFTRTQILTQAGTAMLAQANQLPQSVLQLLR